MRNVLFALLSLFTTNVLSADNAIISSDTLLSDPPANMLLVDVRSAEEYNQGHVPGAINIPHDQIADRINDLLDHKDQPVILYCRSGHRAGLARDVLQHFEFSEVMLLEGHMREWQEKQLPLSKGAEQEQ